MAGLRRFAIQWYRRAFGAPADADIRNEGLDTVLEGNTAIALSEAAISGHAVLGGSSPAGEADVAWLDEIARGGTNLFGEVLTADTAEGPRGIVAAATGLALAGRRATAFLSGPDVACAQDLLISAAGRHAPLVLHVSTRAAAAHGVASGSGHETVHLSADAGFFILFAQNVQQAVDFTFIARRVAEETLVPGLVVMDGEQTALAPQDVRLLSPNQASAFLGAARDEIEAPTEAQKLLFGAMRRRLPAWYDLDEPMLAGARYDRRSFALGAAARRPFFDDFVQTSLEKAFAEFAKRTGREHTFVSQHRQEKLVFVAEGSAVETATRAADVLRKRHKVRAAVVGVHTLRPFPGKAIASALAKAERVIVLERADAPLSGEPPLTREIRAALQLEGGARLACQSVAYGLGGLPLRISDLVALATVAASSSSAPLYLGISLDDSEPGQPKREVLLDALRRAYPDAGKLGVRGQDKDGVPAQKGALTVAIRRRDSGTQLAGQVGALLHSLEGGRVRGRPGADHIDDFGTQIDWLVHGGDKLLDPGDRTSADVTLDVAAATVSLHTNGDSRHFRVDDGGGDEALLGGLFAALVRCGLLDAKARRIAAARRALLEGTDDTQRDDLVAAFQSGFDHLVEDRADVIAPDARRRDGSVPAAVRELGRNDDHVASLPRFWDQAGVLYREGKMGRLTADPFFASGSMPPLSATFNQQGHARSTLPAFDPAACTGCGKCWTHCPDSAIGVVAAGPAALLNAGISKTGAEAVRQVASKLSSRMISSGKKTDEPPATFGILLEDAVAWLMEKAPLPDDRKEAIGNGVDEIVAAFGKLPVAVTKPFFVDAEAAKKDGAELLSIVVNADACMSCGICTRACEPGALPAKEVDADRLAAMRELWETWSATPDTSGASIERAAEHDDIGPAAALLLSRFCQFAMAGGNTGEPGSGEKMAVRLALAATEYHQQPVVQRFANSLAEAGADVSALVRETLSATLPVEDFETISEQLESVASPRVDLATLADRIADSNSDHSIDTAYLLRLIELSRDIAAAHHRVVKGDHGLGRARYALTVSGESTTAWAATFPANPFQVPVLVDASGDAAQIAAGLIEGHLEETAELVRLLRLARLEVDKPDGLDWKLDALAKLRWQDLDDDELALCPPLLLTGSDDMLAGRGLAQLIWLLNSGLPVKVLVLSSLDLGLVGAPTNNPRAGVGMIALAQRSAYVAQTSVAYPEHFGASLSQALSFRGPALAQVYAPSPSRDGFDMDGAIEQASLAVEARVLPLFRYDPRHEGVFGTRISLDGNPEDRDDAPTPVDWACGQRRFAAHFDKEGKVASPALERVGQTCVENWRTLQELAGVVTPFTDEVEAEIRAEVAAEHAAELEAQQNAAKEELTQIRDQTKADIAKSLRSRLLELATRRRG